MRLWRSGVFWVTAGAFVALLAWDASGGDLWLAHLAGDVNGFRWRDSFWLTTVLHQGGKDAAWLLWLALLLALRWPPAFMRRLDRLQRWQLVLGVLAAVAVINLVKYASHTSCPWSLRDFGGSARHVSHWLWNRLDGGPGHCFPAAHASAGFAFMTGWFAWRQSGSRIAAAWLAASVFAGMLLGIAQQLRGAHFMSHTLWTAWICWVAGWLVDVIFKAARSRLAPAPG
ncbi:MAG: phosphatase PAP2 family protein [Ottowia sp.]|nr:phosphatase PAP2 family protein [Ottowia sp.]